MKVPRPLATVFVAVVALFCQAQTAPVIARQRTIVDSLDSNGSVVAHTETLATYLRNSSGSTLVRYDSPAPGPRTPTAGTLADYERHKFYDLDYQKHQATEMANLPLQPPAASSKHVIGAETIKGFRCVIHPIFQIIDGKKEQIGKAWDLAGDGLTVKEDAIIEGRGGSRTHRMRELFDIAFADPDPSEFAFVESFSVIIGPSVPEFRPPASADPVK
jgi:hypothetical protein